MRRNGLEPTAFNMICKDGESGSWGGAQAVVRQPGARGEMLYDSMLYIFIDSTDRIPSIFGTFTTVATIPIMKLPTINYAYMYIIYSKRL